MGQSKESLFCTQILKAMLRAHCKHIIISQLEPFLKTVQDTCPWFSEEGVINYKTWKTVEHQLYERRITKGLGSILDEMFTIWMLLRDSFDLQQKALHLPGHRFPPSRKGLHGTSQGAEIESRAEEEVAVDLPERQPQVEAEELGSIPRRTADRL